MALFTLISDPNHCVGGVTDFRIHRTGCKNIESHTKHPQFKLAGSVSVMVVESAEELVASEVAILRAQDQEYGPEDFTICPCARS